MKCENKSFFIKWYGPFSSQKKLKEWEQEQSFECKLYLLQGKKKYKKKECYYCGKTMRSVSKRLRDNDHHIKEIEEREHKIYAGQFANLKKISDSDVRLVEKLITSYLTDVVGEENLMNQNNFHAPSCIEEVSVINRWYDDRTNREWLRLSSKTLPSIVPDVLVYRYDKEYKQCQLLGSRRLQQYW